MAADQLSYDPDMGEWEFGKLSALREIALALEGPYKYYYMGTFLSSLLLRPLTIFRLLHSFLHQNEIQG